MLFFKSSWSGDPPPEWLLTCSNRAPVETAHCGLAGDGLALTSPAAPKHQRRPPTAPSPHDTFSRPANAHLTTSRTLTAVCGGTTGRRQGGGAGPPGPRAFADPYKPSKRAGSASRKLSLAARDPTSIMAVLEQGLTVKDDFPANPAHDADLSRGPAPHVAPPHEHLTHKPQRNHEPSKLHAVSLVANPAEMAAGEGGFAVTAHPPASAGLLQEGEASLEEPGGSGDEGEAAGQVTLRQQLAAAAAVGPERVRQVEQALVAAVKRRATVYVTKEQVLEKALREVDGDVSELGVRDVRRVCRRFTCHTGHSIPIRR